MKISSPVRAVRSYKQQLVAPPAEVLPLLCPVREADWIVGWDPGTVISESGVVEQDCVFTTDAGATIWYVTRHDAESGVVEMIKITPGVTACRLTIELSPAGEGTAALVTYRHTSLGPEGDAFVAAFTDDYYRTFMQEWEAKLNYYLEHGKAL